MTSMRVLVHIVSFGDPLYALRCADSVFSSGGKTQADVTVVISDNFSSYENQEALTQLAASRSFLRIELNKRNHGYGGAHNLALDKFDMAQFDYVWLLNNDCEVYSDALSHLINAAVRQPKIKMWGATLVDEATSKIQVAGGCTYNKYLSVNTNAFEGVDICKLPTLREPRLDYIAGASIFFPVSTLIELRNNSNDGAVFCTDYFLYFEELDIVKRIASPILGWCREAIVKHTGGASTSSFAGKDSRVGVYHSSLSALIFTRKHYPLCLITVVPIRFLGKVIQLLKQGKASYCHDLMNAYNTFFKRFVK